MSRELKLVISAYDLLSEQQRKLVDAYLSDDVRLDQNKALEIAGYAKYAHKRSSQNPFKNPKVTRAINEKLSPLFNQAGITIERHLEYIASIAYADPRELVDVRRVNCRYCNGKGFNYQWTLAEYNDEVKIRSKQFKSAMGDKFEGMIVSLEMLIDEGMEMPDDSGGYDFDKWLEPNLDCPECSGHGVAEIYVQPSFMNHPLYAGAKVDKNGQIEILMKNQNEALKQVSQLQGFLVQKEEVTHTITSDTLAERRKMASMKADERRIKKEKAK